MNASPEPERLAHQVVRGVTWSYISAMTSGVLRIGVLAALAHLLSPHDFGLMGIAMIFVNFSERLAQVGLGPALVQRVEVDDRHCATALYGSLLTGILIAAVLWWASPAVAAFFNEESVTPILRALAFVFVIEGFAVVPDSMLQRELRFKTLMMVENAAYIAGRGVVSIALACLGYGVWSLIIGLIVLRLLRAVLLNVVHPVRLARPVGSGEFASLLNLGFGFSLGRILNFCALYADNFVVGRLLGASALGIYTRSYQIMTLPSFYIAQVLDRVLFPALARKQRDMREVRRVFLHTLELVSYFAIPVSVWMVCVADEIVHVLLGPQWDAAVPVLQILTLGVFFRTAYKVGDILSRALGAVYQHAWRQAVYTLLVFIGAIFGCGMGGLEGVGTAVLLAVALNYLLMLALSTRLMALEWIPVALAHLPGLWIGAALAIVLTLAMPPLRSLDPPGIVLLCAAGAISLCVAGIAAACAPAPCRLQASSWLLRYVPFAKFGRAAALPIFILERQSRLCSVSPVADDAAQVDIE